jgi:CRISPR system Cascade subunit CasB
MRARLRRARSTLDVLHVTLAVVLARQLGAAPKASRASDWHVRAALDLARVLAHVKAHEGRHPMRAAGWKRFPGDKKESDAGEDRPVLSGARFRRLLETGDDEEKVLAFTRLVALLGGTVNVEQLAGDFLLWNHPEHGDRVRERWAFEYLAAGDAAPPAPPTGPTDTEDDGA